nr:2-C-methyl-D-erythritol 4-phosphate cytidylyltransferase [uncultured Eisenbergiella sp.]
MKEKTAAVVLAAGKGKRMNSDIPKQYMLLRDKPVLYYSLKVFQESFMDEIVLVAEKGEEEFCRKEIVEKYGFTKVKHIAAGGTERYFSVANGLEAVSQDCDYIYIHDGARPFVTQAIIKEALAEVRTHKACVAAMPVKDTIKIADEQDFAVSTPRRDLVWMMQTPQVFQASLIRGAYHKLLSEEEKLRRQGIQITDDAMVVETLLSHPVKLFRASYENIKITTPEDLLIADGILEKRV